MTSVGAKVGSFVPERVGIVESAVPEAAMVAALVAVGGLSSAAADALDGRPRWRCVEVGGL